MLRNTTTTKREPKNIFFDEACEEMRRRMRHGEWTGGIDQLANMYASWKPSQTQEKPVPVPAPIPFPSRKKTAPAKRPVRVAAQLSMFGESGVA